MVEGLEAPQLSKTTKEKEETPRSF